MQEQQPTPPAPESTPLQTPEETPVEETVAPPPPTPKRSIKKIILIVLGSLLLLFILGLVGTYFYLQSQGLTPDKLEPEEPRTTIAPRTPTTNTYKNDNYNFSMPIEKELKVNESSHGFGVTSVEMRYPDTTEEYAPDVQMLIFPKALGAAIGQDFGKTYAAPDNSIQEVKNPSGGDSQSFTKIKNRTVNNLRAFEFRSNPSPEDPNVEAEIGVYIELGTDILILNTAESNRAKLEEMLADFKYPL